MKHKALNGMHRGLSFLLCLVMLLQFFPAVSLAAGENENDREFLGFEHWTLANGSWEETAGLSGKGVSLTTGESVGGVIRSDIISVSGGQKLRAGIWVKAAVQCEASLSLMLYTDAAGKVSAGESIVLDQAAVTGEFTELAADVTVPANVKTVRLQLASNGDCVADDAYIRGYTDLPEFVGVMGDGYGVAGQWSLFYPVVTPGGDWAEQRDMTRDPNGFNYAQIVEDGKNDRGAVRFLRGNVYEHIGIAVGSNLEIGREYTIKLWVKGISSATYGGLQVYGHNDPQLATFGPEGSCKDSSRWYEITQKITATRNHLYLFMSGGAYACDVLIDNVQVLDSNGKDMLEGAGNFTGTGTVSLGTNNLVLNSGFEEVRYDYLSLSEFNGEFRGVEQQTTLDWTLNTDSQDILEPVVDDNGMHIQVVKVAADSVLQSPQIPVTEKKMYQLVLEAKTTGAAAVSGVFYDGDGNALSVWDPELSCNSSDWTELCAYLTAPEGAESFQITLPFSGEAAATLEIDNVALHPCVEPEIEEEPTHIPTTLDSTKRADAYTCPYTSEWVPMYPTGNPDSGTWAAWNASSHYGQIAKEGYQDVGSLNLKSNSGRNVGVAINAGMTAGQKYTLSFWAKGTSNSGRVLSMYANGDAIVIGEHTNLTATWSQYSVTFTATGSQLNILAADWGITDIYLDHITLTDANGVDLLSGKGDFCVENPGGSTPGKVAITLDNSVAINAYAATERKWLPMYPTGAPDNTTWPAWDSTHYGEVVKEGYRDAGSLHLVSDFYKNTAVGIQAGMVIGQTYTLGMWVKGTSNSGNVLISYGNGDFTIIGVSQELGAGWTYYEKTFTAAMGQLNLLVRDWGQSDIYIDNITLKNAEGTDILSGCGDFCEDGIVEEPGKVPMIPITLDTTKHSDAYVCQYTDEWVAMYPSGTPGSTWPAWDSTHYGEIAAEGKQDAGSLRLVSAALKNTGVAINAGMTPGRQYTLGLWAKGTSNSGRVLAMYCNGDQIIITTSDKLSSSWQYYTVTFTATVSQLNILAADWGNTDIYVDNITLTDANGVDLLSGKGDFCVEDPNADPEAPALPEADTSVNLVNGGDFAGIIQLNVPGWILKGMVTGQSGSLTLGAGSSIQSLRYRVEAGQILSVSYTGKNGILAVQLGKDDAVVQTLQVETEGRMFSVPEGADWLRVGYIATDKNAEISEVKIVDMGDPANLDFEIKNPDGTMPLNWTTWTAANDPTISTDRVNAAYTVSHETGTGVDGSNALYVKLNENVPENEKANSLTAVVDSIKVKAEPNSIYSFSYWVKADGENSCVYPSVKCYQADGTADGATQWISGANAVGKSGEWKQYKSSFTTGSQTAYITFRLEMKASNQGAQFRADRLSYQRIGSSLDLNLDFELGQAGEVPLNWTTYQRNYNTNEEGPTADYTVALAPTASKDRSGALKVTKLSGTTTETYVCSAMIPVEPNTAYYFSYDAATTKAAASDQIMMMLRHKKENGDNVSDESKAFFWPSSAYAAGYFNWSEFGAIFETTADTRYIQIMFCFRGSDGYTAFVDNVALTKTAKIEDMNLDFEYSVGQIPLNWQFTNVLSQSHTGIYQENTYSGKQALRMQRENGEIDCTYAYSQKHIPVKAGDKIEVVAHIASRNAVSGQFSMCFFGYDQPLTDTNRMVNAMYGQERVTNAGSEWSQWDTYEMVWTVPKGVNYIQLCLRMGGTCNDMLIDDITVYNYTQSDYVIYQENFADPSTTGLPGGWEYGEITGTGEAKVNGQMSLTGNEESNVEIFTKLYSLKTDYVYALTANVFTTGTASGQLVMEAINWDGTVAGQPVVLDLNTGSVNMELKADFESLSAVYYRLILRKTAGNGSVCIENITLRQSGEPYKGITWAGKWLTHPDETARIANSPHPFTERHYYTRTEINLDKPVETAQMQITVDDKFSLYINGMQVYEETRSGDTWDLPVTVDIAEYLQTGKNVIAIDMFNNIYLYGLIFDGIVKMEDGSSLRFYSDSDTMMAAECLSDVMTPTRNPLWTEEDQMSWMDPDYDISTCPLWVHADEFASIGGGGWGNIDFDPTEYSDYKIFSNEFTFPEEEITAGDTVKVTATLLIEKPLPTSNSFKVDIWKRNTTTRVCSGILTVANGQTTDDWPIGEEFTAEFELQIPQFLSEGKYTVQLENTVSIVSDWFINNKVGYIDVVQVERPLTTTASVEVIDGRATMIVNGEPKAPLWYARPERPAQFEEHTVTKFAEVGVDTIVSYIFLNNIYGEVWTKDGFVPDLVDSMMLDTLAGNPEAQLIVALDFNAPQWWCEENPGEMAALSTETVTKTNASFASDKWKQESMAIMLEAIDHMMSQPYANNIIGFKVTAGYTLEWNWWATSGIYTDVGDFSECGIQAFRTWLTEKYGTDEALQQAWDDSSVTLETVMPPAKELRADEYWDTVATIQDMPEFMDYELYMAQLKADTIEYFCKGVNEHIEDRLIVGTYNGYFFPGGGYEFSSATANVYFQKVLQSEHIDFIKSPWTYGMREIGDTAQFMGPVDSLDPYGKLWIVEEDSRLNLQEMAEGQDGRAGVGWTRNYQQSVEQIKRNFSYILSKGMGVSFYNLMWDFFDDDQYYGAIGQMYEEMTLSLGLENESVAEIALIVDGESQMLIPWEGEYLNHTLYDSIYFEQLKELGNCGASYDLYLLDDLADGLIPEYKIYIFLATTNMTEKEREAVRALQKNGNILVWQFTDAIANGERTELSLIEDMIGMDLSLVSTKRQQIASSIVFDNSHWLTKGMNVGQPYGVESYDTMSPVIAVTDKSATPLAYHSTSSAIDGIPAGQVSLAVKEYDDWTCVYSAVPNMPQIMFRNMQEKTGVHTYTESGSDVIYASSNYVMLHSIFAGERTVKLPGNYTVYDVFNRQIVSENTDSFTVTLSGKETRLFRLSAPETVQVYIGQNNGGTVSNKGLTNLKPGESLEFSFRADAGYRLQYLLVDGVKVYPQADTYGFTDIRESHTVLAHFSPAYGKTPQETPEAEAAPAPVPAPQAEENKWLLPALIGGGAAVLALAVVIAILLAKRKKK